MPLSRRKPGEHNLEPVLSKSEYPEDEIGPESKHATVAVDAIIVDKKVKS